MGTWDLGLVEKRESESGKRLGPQAQSVAGVRSSHNGRVALLLSALCLRLANAHTSIILGKNLEVNVGNTTQMADGLTQFCTYRM